MNTKELLGTYKDKITNEQHEIEHSVKQVFTSAIAVGETLIEAQKIIAHGEFLIWIKEQLPISQKTAYRYIDLYNYRDKLLAGKSVTVTNFQLSDAYKQIEKFKKQEKLEENKKADSRVEEFLDTGVKPDGWRQHTDDKLAKESIEEKVKKRERIKEGEKIIDEEVERLKEEEKNRPKPNEEYEYAKSLLDGLSNLLTDKQNHREKLGLSGDEEVTQDIMYDIIDEYLSRLDTDSRRIEALHNILKYTKRKINYYQTQVGA